MRHIFKFTTIASLAMVSAAGFSQYTFRVVANNLQKPTGIAVAGEGFFKTLFFTQIPTPRVGGGSGGMNSVKAMNIASGFMRTINMGEPEPINIAVAHGELYWTCRSAGVILRRDRSGTIAPILTGLNKPTGIYVDQHDQTYFTQVPTPGVGGGSGGQNTVDVFTNGSIFNLTRGEPDPTDIVVDREGTAYWTCKSAGVILERTRLGVVSLLANNLMSPNGIALNRNGNKLFWTEVPTPGVPGSMGGLNKVKVMNLETMITTVINSGDPEPTDIAVARDGTVYWTCTSAGVIVEARLH